MIKQYKKRTHTTYGIVNKRRANKKKKEIETVPIRDSKHSFLIYIFANNNITMVYFIGI